MVHAVEPLMLAPLVLPSLVYALAALMALEPARPRARRSGLVLIGHIVVFAPLMFRTCSASPSG